MTSIFLERVDALAQISQQKLAKILDSIPGKKNLIIEPSLMKPLDRFIGASVLRYHGIDKMYRLDKAGPLGSCAALIYLIRADLITGKVVCNQINSFLTTESDLKYHIIIVPKLLASVELLFEEEGLLGIVNFHVFSWELIQLDTKVLSYETPKIFKQLFIHNDQSLLSSVAKSLWSLHHVFGKPHLSIFHGKYASLVANLVDCWDEELGSPDKPDSDIGCLLVLDRDIDYASVLLMSGTYTSLISEVMNVDTGTVKIMQKNKENKETAVSMLLTSEDELYAQIKNKYFCDVNVYLKQKAVELISEKNKGTNMSIKEMKTFVEAKLMKLRNESMALSNHSSICERICSEMGQKFETLLTCQTNILYGEARQEVLTVIEELMATSEDMYLPLRLICLFSLAQDGFTPEESNSLKKQFFHSYGFEHLSTFYNLEKIGLFSTSPFSREISKITSKFTQVMAFPKRNTFQTTAQRLKLFPDVSKDYCLKNPQDAAYVFGGAYIPVVAQVVSYLIKKEMSLNELVKSLPQTSNGKSETKLVGSQTDGAVDISPRTVMVYVIGGITYAEIAALQFIEGRTGCRILCCGSNIVNAKSILMGTTSRHLYD